MIASPFSTHPHPQHTAAPFPIGRAVRTTRPQLEARFGLWCAEPELSEDGRAFRLGLLPGNGMLFLTRTGGLLSVHPRGTADEIVARLFSGPADLLWREVEACYAGVRLGEGELQRYWVLREPIGPTAAVYGVFDLQTFRVLGRGTNRDEIAGRVAMGNAGYDAEM